MMRMYNFTAEVREALARAREEAGRLRHGYVGTEHLAMALLQPRSTAVSPLVAGLDRDALVAELERRAGTANEPPGMGPDRPYTSSSRRVLELAMRAAAARRDEAVGSEHLLFALLREQRGIGGQVLRAAGLEADAMGVSPRRSALDGPAIPRGPAGWLRRLLLLARLWPLD